MTTKELIEELQKIDPKGDVPIFFRENGDIVAQPEISVKTKNNLEEFYDEFGYLWQDGYEEELEDLKAKKKVIVITPFNE